MNEENTIRVAFMGDLPESDKYTLPNWSKYPVHHRATAWAYLHREDGGDYVVLNDQRYGTLNTTH